MTRIANILLAVSAAFVLFGADHPTAETAATRTITVTDNSYSRSSLRITKNDTVTWKWDDTANKHNVTVDSGPVDFHSKTRSGSYEYSRKFRTTGTYRLICTRHPDDMKLKLTVKKP
jgi:plastocyanin